MSSIDVTAPTVMDVEFDTDDGWRLTVICHDAAGQIIGRASQVADVWSVDFTATAAVKAGVGCGAFLVPTVHEARTALRIIACLYVAAVSR